MAMFILVFLSSGLLILHPQYADAAKKYNINGTWTHTTKDGTTWTLTIDKWDDGWSENDWIGDVRLEYHFFGTHMYHDSCNGNIAPTSKKNVYQCVFFDSDGNMIPTKLTMKGNKKLKFKSSSALNRVMMAGSTGKYKLQSRSAKIDY